MAKIPTPRFNLKPDTNLIFLIFRYRGSRVQISTRENVEPKDWNDNKKNKTHPYQRAIEREGQPDLVRLNRQLDHLAQLCKDIYIENGYGDIHPADFKKELEYRAGFEDRPVDKFTIQFVEPYREGERPNDFLRLYVDELIEQEMKTSTLKPLQLHADNLRRFAKDEGVFNYDDINWDFRKQYIQWMEKHRFSLGYGNKSLTILRHFAEKAKQAGCHSNNRYLGKGWTVPAASDKGDRIAFSQMELGRLADLDLYGDKEIARDLILIGAGTGQRWSDFSRYTPDHFRTSPKGVPLLEIFQRKTGTRVVVPLNIFPWLVPTLQKYDYTSPALPSQKLNELVKQICQEAGIDSKVVVVDQYIGMKPRVQKSRVEKWKEVSSHCCRRSFATILYWEMGISPARIMRCTGHKHESTFFKYVGIQDEENAEELGLEFQHGRRIEAAI